MDHNSTNSHQNTDQQINIIKPFETIGKLVFFDYIKNKFGFISEVKDAKGLKIDKVHVPESGLSANRRLSDGETVCFTLNKGNRGYYASNVRPVEELTIKSVSKFIENVGVKEMEKIIYNSIGDYYQLLDENDKLLIDKVIYKESTPDSWALLNKIESNELKLETFLNSLLTYTDDDIVLYLKKSYSDKLLRVILEKWNSGNKKSILELTNVVSSRNTDNCRISENFTISILSCDFTFDELLKIHLKFKHNKILNKLLSLFSFKTNDFISNIKSVFSTLEITEDRKLQLTSIFLLERNNIDTKNVFRIFNELGDFGIIKNENELLQCFSERILSSPDLGQLIFHLSNDFDSKLFRQLLSVNFNNVYSWSLISVLQFCDEKHDIAKIIIDEYYSAERDFDFAEYKRLIRLVVILSIKYLDKNSTALHILLKLSHAPQGHAHADGLPKSDTVLARRYCAQYQCVGLLRRD